MADFPQQWMPGASKKRAGGGGMPTPTVPPPQSWDYQRGGGGVAQEEGDVRHPHIVKFMRPWLEKFGSPLRFGQILENGGVSYNDLPVGCFSTSGGSPCWNFVLDKCKFKNCKKPHIVGARLPQGYPQKLTTALEPAMQVCYRKFTREQWRSKQGGNAYKRQCV